MESSSSRLDSLAGTPRMSGSSMPRRCSSASSNLSISSLDPNVTSLKRVGLRKEFATIASGASYAHTPNTDGTKTASKKVEAPPDNTQPNFRCKQLYLVRHNQAEGEPFHWSLETADVEGGDLEGNIYQDGVPVPTLSNSDIRDYFVLIPGLTPELENIVKNVAESEPPPRAKTRKEVKENCQSWAIRVMKRLAELGMHDGLAEDC